MRILVDADACPVVKQIESVARRYRVPVTLFCDTNHVLQSEYSEVNTVGAGADAVDFAIVNLCRAGDIVVTQDYGLAAMALGRGAYAIHSSGLRYTDENIGRMLEERHLAKKLRRVSRNSNLRGIKKLTQKDDGGFKAVLKKLIHGERDREGENGDGEAESQT